MRRSWTRSAAVVGGWTVVALVSTSQWYFFRLSSDRPAPLGPALLGNLASCWLWAAFTPAIVWLARHRPLDRRGWLRHLPWHLAGALTLAAIDVLADITFDRWFPSSLPPLSPLAAFFGKSFLNFFSYAAVVAITYAVDYHALFVDRQLTAERLEKELLAARLEAIESRLRPHFLFNTLHTVASLVRTGRNADAVRTVAALSDLLRSSLRRDGRAEIPLREELAFVRRYLEIEQVRFHDRLATGIVAGPDVLDALVPTLLLQPLVENAIRHGIERRAAPGRIEVVIGRRGAMLVVRVEDSSAGPVRWPEQRAGHGIGLRATRDRLRHLYGDRQRCELTATVHGGMAAVVELPFHQDSGLELPAALEAAGAGAGR